ncbi:MAG: hypothetical protein U9R15_05950 [Chloroflexota bacterium]|nr:hypothetical protein [Chloroflexota bacterium]
MTYLGNHRRAVERILEDEALTSDLTDDSAALLLDWGLAQAKAMTQQAEDIGARLIDLRRAMKRINREGGKAAPEVQVERVRMLLTGIKTEHIPKVENDT